MRDEGVTGSLEEISTLILSTTQKMTLVGQDEWLALIESDKEIDHVSRDRLRATMVEGIPEKLRGKIWCVLCKVKEESGLHSRSLYRNLIDIEDPIEEYKI